MGQVEPSVCHLSTAGQQAQHSIAPARLRIPRCAIAAVPNVIDVGMLKYILNSFEERIARKLIMPTHVQNYRLIRLSENVHEFWSA